MNKFQFTIKVLAVAIFMFAFASNSIACGERQLALAVFLPNVGG